MSFFQSEPGSDFLSKKFTQFFSADESVTPFPIFVRSWFQLRMSYFGSPPFQDTMLTSFFQPLLDSESTPILLRYSAGILGNSITDESRTVF